ncbi:hypothetical protein BKA56DRAFT_611906 [Ilyonectria sp. MPI-CAGE-AT-0026]|nr:hypothetical protein BKA56DRAFT_611906 [Ilyonectria sp. MPI-CAGE-AT-0026]
MYLIEINDHISRLFLGWIRDIIPSASGMLLHGTMIPLIDGGTELLHMTHDSGCNVVNYPIASPIMQGKYKGAERVGVALAAWNGLYREVSVPKVEFTSQKHAQTTSQMHQSHPICTVMSSLLDSWAGRNAANGMWASRGKRPRIEKESPHEKLNPSPKPKP